MTSHAPRESRTGNARSRAAEALSRVEREGAFAAAVLDASLDRLPALDPRDRALATELVYGVLRTAPALDRALGRHAKDGERSLAKLDPWTRAVLRVGAYQILALGRVPPRAAVDAAVEDVKRSRTPRLAGFVNAVLRRLGDARPESLPDDARVSLALASVPDAVRARLSGLLGDEGAGRYLQASFARTAPVVLRVQPSRITRESLLARLAEELPGAEVTPGEVSPLAVRVVGGGDPTRALAWREGLYGVQEEGAQAVALASGVAPGMKVLDACAGRGGKSALAATLLRGRGLLHATDLFPAKLTRLKEELARLGLDAGLSLETFPADLTRGLGGLGRAAPEGGYDVALVDAPCSGLGTLARRPDLLSRLRDEAAWGALTELQHALLERIAPLVAKGGALTYAVCTLTREEGDDVVARFLQAHPEFAPDAALEGAPPRLRASRVVLTTDADGTDGFVLHRLRRAG